MTVVPKIRSALYRDMFLIAKQQATLSEQAKQLGNNKEELHSSLVAIIMACCCLEAFINTYAMQKQWKEWESYQWEKIRAKWLNTTQGHSIDGKTFNEQSQPFSDFTHLFRLRNSIIHYTSKPTRPVIRKGRLISKQEAKFTASKALWAVETTKRMIEEFCKFTGEPLPDWLES